MCQDGEGLCVPIKLLMLNSMSDGSLHDGGEINRLLYIYVRLGDFSF